jgi:enterochelin esterase-like enzyme
MAVLTAELHWTLNKKHISHTYTSHPGSHNENYWQEHLAEYLGFYAGGW